MAYKSIFDTKASSSSSSSGSGYQSIFDKKATTTKKNATSGYNLNTTEGLKKYAESQGLEIKEKKPSLFVRAMDLMSRPVYASAGAAKAIVRGDENILQEAWKGLKGEEKETYSDVLKEAGVENKIARGLVGFALDVALDPTTYFGGSALKYAGKGAVKVGGGAMRVTERFSPKLAEALTASGKGIKDAIGTAFVDAYKTSGDLGNLASKHFNRVGLATEDAIRNIDEVFKELPKGQHTEFAQTLIDFRKQLPKMEKAIKEGSLDDFNKAFRGSRPIKGVRDAEKVFGGAKGFDKKFEGAAMKVTDRYQKTITKFNKKIERLKKKTEVKLLDRKEFLEFKVGKNTVNRTAALSKNLERVLKNELDLFTGDLQDIQKGLKGAITKDGAISGTVKDLPKATKKEYDDIIESTLKPLRDEMELEIQQLQKELLDSAGKEFLNKPLGFKNSKEAIAKMLQGKIINTQNEYADAVNKIEKTIANKINESKAKLAKKLEDKQAEITSKILKVQNETGIKKAIADKFFSSRKLAKDDLNKMTPEFKTKEQADFFNNKYKKLVDEMADSANMPKELRFNAYYPSIDATKLKSPGVGGGIEVGKESYAKLFKGVNKNELDKPIEALARTQANIIRDNTARETLNEAVKAYGLDKKAFKALPEEEQAMYKLVKEKKFGKEIGYLKQVDFDYLNNRLFPDMKVIDMLAKNSGYDSFNKVFKTAVTSYFPAFHIRNAISGMIQNYEVFGARAFDPTIIADSLGILKGVNKDLKLGGKIFNAKELNKVLKENFGMTSSYIADLGKYIEDLGGGKFKVLGKFNPRRIGDFVETNQKAMAMITGLKQGKSIDEAVKLAERAGFNYQKLTAFESKIMRRIIPFYSFMRKNAELQVRTLIKNPERILAQKKVADAFSNMFGEKVTEEDLKGVPPWALQGLGFKVKDNKYVASFGVPMEEFINRVNNPMMSTLSSLSPVIKYPLESKMGYDFFRQQKIIDLNKIAPASGALLLKADEEGKLPDWLSKAINIGSYTDNNGVVKYTMSPKALHLLRNIPTSRFQNTFEKVFDKDMDKANKYAALFTGGKIYDIDVDKQKYFTERNMTRDIQDWLESIGRGKTFEQFYVPKTDEEKKAAEREKASKNKK